MNVALARSSDTRERILSAAAIDFAERGYAGTSIGGIAEKSGVGKGLVQYHFKAKSDLAVAIVEDSYPRAPFTKVLGDANGFHGIEGYVGCIRGVTRSFRDDVRTRAAVRLMREFDLIPATLPTPYVGWIERVAEFITEARDEGEIPGGRSEQTEAWHMVAGYYGVLELSDRLNGRADLMERVEEMLEGQLVYLGVADPQRYLAAS